MAATIYGGIGKYGLTSELSGNAIYVGSMTYNISTEQAFIKDHQGEDQAFSIYNEASEISMSGVTAAAGTITSTVAGVLALANTDIDVMSGASTYAVTAMNFNRTNTDFETGEMTAIGRPAVTVA